MADGTGYSNSIRAGAFLLTAALTGLVIVIVLSKSSVFTSTAEYDVRFGMEDGVAGLEIGSEVRVAGLKVGRVVAIDPRFDEGRIDVRVRMRSDILVKTDAEVLRSQPLLGNFSWLNFSNLGSETAPRLEPGKWIEARKSGGLLATIVGPANAGSADKMFTNLVEFTDSLADFARVQYPQRVVPLLSEAQTVVGNLGRDYETWRTKITAGLGDAASALRKLDTTMDDASAGVKDARATLAHVREKNLPQIDAILEDGVKGADRLAGAMERLDTELTARVPDVRALLWDLRQAGAQIKLATMEVRRSPWKLLYQPSGDELARENLYESARAFAIASSDLRVAGETLDAVLAQAPERFANDPAFRDAIRGSVIDSVERWEKAQQRLFDVLGADFGPSAAPEGPAGPANAAPIAVPTGSMKPAGGTASGTAPAPAAAPAAK